MVLPERRVCANLLARRERPQAAALNQVRQKKLNLQFFPIGKSREIATDPNQPVGKHRSTTAMEGKADHLSLVLLPHH
jgi:hypothetical protein